MATRLTVDDMLKRLEMSDISLFSESKSDLKAVGIYVHMPEADNNDL